MKRHVVTNRRSLSNAGLLFLSVLAVTLASCRSDDRLSDSDLPCVILISIDTCRADHLSCYGHERQTTPLIDRFAERAVVFRQAVSPVPLTLPAHASMLCGTVPICHGVHANIDSQVHPSNLSLAEVMREHGYTTAAFISAFVLDSQFGLDQGFDTYQDDFQDSHSHLQISERRGEEVTRLACGWLDEHHTEDFFLFLHYYDPHSDYRPPEPFSAQFGQGSYDGEIAYVDHCIGEVLEKLRELDIYDSALIVITSDHGEGLGQHAENEHSFFIYQSVVHVPLIIKPPHWSSSKTVEEYVGIIDIAPTILGALGITPPEAMQGHDLSPIWSAEDGIDVGRLFLCESLEPTKYGCNPLYGVVGQDWKYIQAPRAELYNLVEDPQEESNLATMDQRRSRELRARLNELLVSQACPLTEGAAATDADSLKRLASLGYVGGIDTDSIEFDPDKPDAKDFIDYHRLSRQYKLALDARQFEQAQRLCDELLALYPDRLEIRLKSGGVAQEQGHAARALKQFEVFVKAFPRHAEGRFRLGRALLDVKRYDQAVVQLEEALRLQPDNHAAHGNLGLALMQLGRAGEAAEHFRAVLQQAPDDAEALGQLGTALAQQKRFDQAGGYFRKAIEIDSQDWQLHTKMGTALSALGQHDQALNHWRTALRLSDGNPQAEMTVRRLLALRAARQGQIDQAVEHWEKIILLDPSDVAALYSLGKAAALRADDHAALSNYQLVLELDADHVGAMNNLAWLLATSTAETLRDTERAVELAERANKLERSQSAASLDTLAVAYAAHGDFASATASARQALEQAVATRDLQLAEQIKSRLRLFESGQPYQQPKQ